MVAGTSAQAQSRRRALPSYTALRELAIFAAAYLTYFGVRALTESEPGRAFENAMTVHRVEVDLGVDWEGAVQGAVLGSRVLVDLTNAVYIYGHWPVLIVAGVLLYRYRRRHYYRLRNVCLLTGLVGLVIFAAFPVAPPRLTDLPVIDTVTRDAEGYRQLLPPSFVNEYAAMPSFHAGWNLLVGVIAFGAFRHWLARGFAVLMPAAMAFAVVATANHFVVDVLAGVAIVLLALVAARWLERRRLDRGDAHERSERPPGRTATVRRGASCGQRPLPAPGRGGARPRAGRS
jgi:hypothetical protein